MANNRVRVIIPENPDELIALMKAVLKKHEEDGENSILHLFDMLNYRDKVETGDTQNELSKQLKKDSETATEQRDINIGIADHQTTKTEGTGLHTLTSIRDTLLGIYKGREKELGKWGFTVDDSPRKKNS